MLMMGIQYLFDSFSEITLIKDNPCELRELLYLYTAIK